MKNLETLYAQATDQDKLEGCLAYRRYHRVLRRFASFYGFGIVPTVEVFAATSPNSDYHGNLRSTASILDAVRKGIPMDRVVVSTYNACGRRAYGYATGEVSFLDTVGGEKITCFRENLLYPRTSKRCTIDGHMFAAWLGKTNMTMKQAALEFGRSKRHYAEVEADVAKLARRHKMLPHQMQAVLWITRKRVNAVKYTEQLHMSHGKYDVSRILCDPQDYPPYPVKPPQPKVIPSHSKAPF